LPAETPLPPESDVPVLPERVARLYVVGVPLIFCAILTGTAMAPKGAEAAPPATAGLGVVELAGAVLLGAMGGGALVALLRRPRGIGPSRFLPPAYIFAGLFGVMAYIASAFAFSYLFTQVAGLGVTGDLLANILAWTPAVALAWKLEQCGPNPLLPWGSGLGLAAWPLILMVLVPVGLFNLALLDGVGIAAPEQGVMTAYRTAPSQVAQLLFMVAICVVAPLCEELVFRGVLYRGMRDMAGKPAAVIGSALLFTAIHLSPTHVLGVFTVGCVLALLYERAGTIVAPMTLHVAHNTGALFIADYLN
jgi:membrane protease YdiL (CAAX protease family)